MVATSQSDNTERMLPYHNIAEGKRIFVLGNGPSLLTHDLTKLAGEDTFCCNSIGEWEALPFAPTYYGVSDLWEYKWLERNRFPHWGRTERFNVRFQGWPDHDAFLNVEKAPDSIQVFSHGCVGLTDTLPAIPTARTTPLTLAQLALWMGYTDIYMMGIEQTRGYAYDPEAIVSMTGRHSFPIDKNPKYQLGIQRCAKRMREDMESAGRHIYDMTPEGLLNGRSASRRNVPVMEILEYRDYEEVLA